jgi:addiction module HigA family antidote
MTSKRKLLKPIHPGEILLEEFMRPLGISINRLARDIAVPQAASAPLSTASEL